MVGSFNGSTQVGSPFGPGDNLSNGSGSGLDKVLIFTVGSDGKFTSQGDYAIGSSYGALGIVVADFNHDGKTNLAVTDYRVGKVTVLLNDASAKTDFTLTSNTPPQTVKAGDKTQFNYVLEATNGQLPQIQLSCSGLPQGATCSFDSLSPGQVANGWVTVQTTARTTGSLGSNPFLFFAMVLPLGFVVLPGGRRRRIVYVGLLLLAFAVVLETGCSGGAAMNSMSSNAAVSGAGPSNMGSTTGASSGGSSSGGVTSVPPATGPTPAGSYQVTISATGATVTHTSVVTLIVQ